MKPQIKDLYTNAIRFYQNESVSYKNAGQMERLNKVALPFYEAYNSAAEQRQIKLSEIVKLLDEGPIAICTFNEGFISLFKNWVASCDHYNVQVRNSSIVFPMDKPADVAARALGFHTCFLEGGLGPVPAQAAKVYADDTFVACMFAKNAVVQAMLPFNRDILFQDIDMVWRKDPRLWLENNAKVNDLDFQFMYDGYNARFQPLYYNSGFIYIKNTALAKAVWQVVFDHYDKVLYYRSQQTPINIIMNTFRERGLSTQRMPEALFVNGHMTPIDASKVDPELIENSYVVHCSWTHNLEKKYEKLKLHNLWYL